MSMMAHLDDVDRRLDQEGWTSGLSARTEMDLGIPIPVVRCIRSRFSIDHRAQLAYREMADVACDGLSGSQASFFCPFLASNSRDVPLLVHARHTWDKGYPYDHRNRKILQS